MQQSFKDKDEQNAREIELLEKQYALNEQTHNELTSTLLDQLEKLKIQNQVLKRCLTTSQSFCDQPARPSNRTDAIRQESQTLSSARPLLLQPKHFGLDQWNADHHSIQEHLENVSHCIQEARNLGCSELSLIRLLLNTLPKDYQFLKDFIPKEKHTSYETFAREVLSILDSGPETTMEEFINTKRKICESPLAYFQRVTSLYKAANGLIGDHWLNDKFHVTPIYAKITESLYRDAKNDLRRRVENDLNKKCLTMTSLRRHLIEVHRLGLNKDNYTAESRVARNMEGSGSGLKPAMFNNMNNNFGQVMTTAGQREDSSYEESNDENEENID